MQGVTSRRAAADQHIGPASGGDVHDVASQRAIEGVAIGGDLGQLVTVEV